MTDLPEHAHWHSYGTFGIPVAGTSHYRSVISSIAENVDGVQALVICLAYLVPDNQNIHDSNAVKVVIRGQTVGHLPRDFAKTYRSYIRDLPSHALHVSVAAAITNGLRTSQAAYEYTIELDIPDDLRIHLLSKPLDDEPTRVNGYVPLQRSADGRYFAQVWVPTPNFNELHSSRKVEEWTTESWETVNFYATNRQGIGLGLKVYALPKKQYTNLFGLGPTSGTLVLDSGRFATLRIGLE